MLTIGNVQLDSNLLLAPIAGYCDLAFRLVVRAITCPIPGTDRLAGVGLACTDLLSPHAILRQNSKSLRLAATCVDDQPLCMQLYGVDPKILVPAAQWAAEHGAAIIDINMGCPVDKVTKKNGGSKLLCDPSGTVQLAKQIVRAVKIPVTAKIRLGWDEQSIVAPSLAPALADVGIQAITVHGRTALQKFRGQCQLNRIAQVVDAMKRFPGVPVIGNGDVKSPHDAKRLFEQTGCHGVMIGRGALGQPWIFRDATYYLATGSLPEPIARADKARIVLEHFRRLLELRSERVALNTIKKRISWYSAHLQPWPGLRRGMDKITSAAQFCDLFESGIELIQDHQVPSFRAPGEINCHTSLLRPAM